MDMIKDILPWAFWILVGLAAAFILLFVRVGFAFRKAFGTRAPMKITITPSVGAEFSRKDEVGRMAGEFKRLGFDDAGAFSVAEMPGTLLMAMLDSRRDLTAVVYDHPVAGVWSEVTARYRDGGAVSAANSKYGGRLDWPDNIRMLHELDAAPERLVSMVERGLERKPLKRVSAWEFAGEFERGYAEIMEWRAKRGGATKEEVVRVSISMGKGKVDDSVIDDAVRIEGLKAALQLSKECLENFVKNGGLQQHGVRKSAVATIHDRLPLDGILAFLGEEAGDLLSEQEKASLKPRELFRLVISRMEDGPPFTYIGSVREPVEADFYAKI